jgi:hypothetical protein
MAAMSSSVAEGTTLRRMEGRKDRNEKKAARLNGNRK